MNNFYSILNKSGKGPSASPASSLKTEATKALTGALYPPEHGKAIATMDGKADRASWSKTRVEAEKEQPVKTWRQQISFQTGGELLRRDRSGI